MKTQSTHTRSLWQAIRPYAYVLLALALLAAVMMPVFADAPPAGTHIGNQASATYTDASNVSRTATSNLVSTVVQQVYSLTLASTQTKYSSPGAQVVFPHTLTNTGNGTDSFDFSTGTGGAVTLTGIHVYVDANGDGIPDNATDIAATGSGAVAAGGTFRFVVVGTVPVSATSGQSGTITITTTSHNDTTVPKANQNNVDTATVASNAVIGVVKSMSSNTGTANSGPYTITLTYTNSGNIAANNVTLTDLIPDGFVFQNNTGAWSGCVGALNNNSGGAPVTCGSGPTITYDFGVTTANTVTAKISTVPAGVSGTVSFQVKVDTIASGDIPANHIINNTAQYRYNDGTGLPTTLNVGPLSTNTVSFTVQGTAGLTIAPLTNTVASASQGATITYTEVVTNTGTNTDAFNITLAAGAPGFPAGTTFQLYKSDGVTPLVDTNGDGIPDTGPVPAVAGNTYSVVIKAILPPSATGGPFNETVTAASTVTGVSNPGQTASATLTLTAVTASTVDVTNDSAYNAAPPAPGQGIGPEGSAIVTNSTNPGTTTKFTLYVNNRGNVADTYTMSAPVLPSASGLTMSVQFYLSGCASPANPISNTGTVNALSSAQVCAVVTVPAGFVAGTYAIHFMATSPTSGAADTIHDAVTVNAVHALTLTPNNTGQIFPGGTVVYTHTLANNGNVSEHITPNTATIADSNSSGWSSVPYADSNTNGSLDGTDTVFTTVAAFDLAPGQSRTIFVKVVAPAGASAGDQNVSTLTISLGVVATDTTDVISGQLRLTKAQVNASCATADPRTLTYVSTNVNAKPGDCVWYAITGVNQGTTAISLVVISDATPGYTVYQGGAIGYLNNVAAGAGAVTNPAGGAAGTVGYSVGTMNPNDTAVLYFAVKVNQ